MRFEVLPRYAQFPRTMTPSLAIHAVVIFDVEYHKCIHG